MSATAPSRVSTGGHWGMRLIPWAEEEGHESEKSHGELSDLNNIFGARGVDPQALNPGPTLYTRLFNY